jgi:ubiquinone/menaquinone biosynthesis C-methylase UbiE
MVKLAREKMEHAGFDVHLQQGNVERLPFQDNRFDTVINTMALSGYPDGSKAMDEMKRVLKPGGRLLLIDFDYPENRNLIGFAMVRIWEKFGDIIKDIDALLTAHNFDSEHHSVGGFGSVHLYIAVKRLKKQNWS